MGGELLRASRRYRRGGRGDIDAGQHAPNFAHRQRRGYRLQAVRGSPNVRRPDGNTRRQTILIDSRDCGIARLPRKDDA